MLAYLAIACRLEPTPTPDGGPAAAQPHATTDTEAPPVDLDRDGWTQEDDCNDQDPAIHPEALERCNGMDDACDGGVEDGAISVLRGEAYATLEEAVASAPEHAEILVCPGVYPEALSIPRAMVVTAIGGPAVTLLDGGDMRRPLTIRADGVEVRGFTIASGFASWDAEGGGGGGVYLAPDVDALLTDVVVTGNATDGEGGGILLDRRATLTLVGAVTANTAPDGAGAWLRAGATLTGASLVDNTAVVGGGAGLDPGASLVQVEVADNFASAGGGGVYASGGEFRLVDTTIAGNTSSWQGGGLSVQQGTAVLEGQSEVILNSAGRAGGGIELFDAVLVGGIVKSNHADLIGGGIYALRSQIVGTSVEGNDAEQGGGIATDMGRLELEDVTVRANLATLGGGVFVGSVAFVTGSVITENQAVSGGALYVARHGSVSVIDTDLGAGPIDNAPDDIAIENGNAGLQALAGDLFCDENGCW